MIGLCHGEKGNNGKRVRERGKGPSGAVLTSLEGNGEGKPEKGCKWTSHPSITSETHMAESPFSVTTEVKAENKSVHLFPHFWPVIVLQGPLPTPKNQKKTKKKNKKNPLNKN